MISKHGSQALKIAFVFFAIMTIYRMVFLGYCAPADEAFTFSNVLSDLWLGACFDAQRAAIPGLVFLVLGAFKIFSPLHKEWARHGWIVLFTGTALILYLLLLHEDKGLVWESFDMVWLLLILLVCLVLSYFRFKKILHKPSSIKSYPTSKRKRVLSFIVIFLIFGLAIGSHLGQLIDKL